MEQKILEYIEKRSQWKDGLIEMRDIIRETEMEEEIKWGAPVYTLEGKNVVGLVGMKSYMGLWFYQGVFLSDPHGLLEQSSKDTRGLRKMVFTSIEDFQGKKVHIRSYLEEAIENQKAGKEIRPVRSKKLVIPTELQSVLDEDSDLNAAFDRLTPGKKREYAEYIDSAKQEPTKVRRIQKIIPLILDGKGLNDKYK